jgi:hypothetical protein
MILDGRKQPIRGLWQRNGAFYARLDVDDDAGIKETHLKQGSATDVQYAIWHFTDGFDPDASANPAAVAMIADADANGTGFTPGADGIMAVAVSWQRSRSEPIRSRP